MCCRSTSLMNCEKLPRRPERHLPCQPAATCHFLPAISERYFVGTRYLYQARSIDCTNSFSIPCSHQTFHSLVLLDGL